MQTTRHSMLRAVAAAASAALLVTALTVPVAAAPKGEDIQTEFPPQPDVICDGGETLEVIVVGWLQPKEWGLRYKIKLVYTNKATGDTWHYSDAGILKDIGETGYTLSGRNTNHGPGDTSWSGRVVCIEGVCTRTGHSTGDLAQVACDRLTT